MMILSSLLFLFLLVKSHIMVESHIMVKPHLYYKGQYSDCQAVKKEPTRFGCNMINFIRYPYWLISLYLFVQFRWGGGSEEHKGRRVCLSSHRYPKAASRWLFVLHMILHRAQCAVHIAQSTVHRAQCTVHSAQCAVPHSPVHFRIFAKLPTFLSLSPHQWQ